MWRRLVTALLLASSSSSWHMVLVGGSVIVDEHTLSTTTTRRALSSSTTAPSSTTCNLPCQNGGLCKLKSLFPTWGTDTSGLVQGNETIQEPTCDCTDTAGYIGVYCNVRVQPCALTSTVICLYGSQCVKDDSGFHCECNATSQNDGTNCQHHQTEVCSVPGRQPGQGAASFCVNDGVCDGNGGCRCQQGYGGPHCEYISGDLVGAGSGTSVASNGKGRGNVAFASAIAVVAFVMAVVAGMLYGRHRKRRYQANREQAIVSRTLLGTSNTTTSGPFDHPERKNIVLDMGPQKDFDGNELEEVEII